MNAPFLHRSLTEYKYSFLNRVLTSDIIYGDSGSFNSRSNIWTYQYEQVFPMLYGEGYAIHEHLAPFELVYLKERTGFFAEGPDIGTSGLYNNLSIDEDLGNVNSSIETGCNTHRQTDWVKDKPGQEAYFDKNVTSKDDPDLKGRIYVGKTFRELRENNFLYYGDEKGDLHQLPLPIFALKEDTREAVGQGANFDNSSLALDIGGGIYGGLRTAVTPGNQWLGTNGKYYNNSWGGNRYTGSRSGAFAASNTYKWAGRATVVASAIIGGIQVYNGYQMDGGQFGYNANVAGASATGSIVGGWAGAEAGITVGAAIGVWFGGVGAVPGAIIGGFVGGITGSLTGNKVGEMSVNYYYGR